MRIQGATLCALLYRDEVNWSLAHLASNQSFVVITRQEFGSGNRFCQGCAVRRYRMAATSRGQDLACGIAKSISYWFISTTSSLVIRGAAVKTATRC